MLSSLSTRAEHVSLESILAISSIVILSAMSLSVTASPLIDAPMTTRTAGREVVRFADPSAQRFAPAQAGGSLAAL
jgi:hypothetical protein